MYHVVSKLISPCSCFLLESNPTQNQSSTGSSELLANPYLGRSPAGGCGSRRALNDIKPVTNPHVTPLPFISKVVNAVAAGVRQRL